MLNDVLQNFRLLTWTVARFVKTFVTTSFLGLSPILIIFGVPYFLLRIAGGKKYGTSYVNTLVLFFAMIYTTIRGVVRLGIDLAKGVGYITEETKKEESVDEKEEVPQIKKIEMFGTGKGQAEVLERESPYRP